MLWDKSPNGSAFATMGCVRNLGPKTQNVTAVTHIYTFKPVNWNTTWNDVEFVAS